MHVGFIATPDLSYVSGSSLSLRYTVEALGRLGVRCTVLCQRAPAGEVGDLVTYRELPMPLDYQVMTDTRPSTADLAACVGLLVEAIASLEDVDLLHAVYGTFTGVAATIGGALVDVPVVISTFGRDLSLGAQADGRYRQMMRISYAASDLVVAADEAMAAVVARDYGTARADVRIVPPGMSFNALGRATRARQRDGVRRRVLAVQSSFNENKGLALLVAAFAPAREVHPDACLVVVGHDDTPDARIEAQLRAEVGRLGLDGAVEFLGHLDHHRTVEVMTGCDLLVDPRTIDSFSSCVYEAMAVGVPVVASDVPCNRAALDGGAHGLLVPPGNVPALTGGILQVLGDPHLADQLVASAGAGVAVAARTLDCQVVADQLLGHYETVLTTRHPSIPLVSSPARGGSRA